MTIRLYRMVLAILFGLFIAMGPVAAQQEDENGEVDGSQPASPTAPTTPDQTSSETVEQALIVYFNYGSTDLGPLHALETELASAINEAAVGEYDGHEIALDGSHGRLYMYGPDVDELFDVVRPILERSPFMQGAQVEVVIAP